jgi:hypothetical protein
VPRVRYFAQPNPQRIAVSVNETSRQPKTCVVVSYWTGRPENNLRKLLRQMITFDSGSPFNVVIVCNGGNVTPLSLPTTFASLRARVFNRENTGWNLGAWDFGWRNAGKYDYFLFLQDDCFIKSKNWISDFEFRMANDPGIGLLGEEIMWDSMTWSFIRKATDRDLGRAAWPPDEPDHPLDTYQRLLKERGIPIGQVGTHVPSIILFTSRDILEEVDGFPLIGSSYRQAVASEIGISRVIASKGYRITRVKGEGNSFRLVGHREWTSRHRSWMKIRGSLRNWASPFLHSIRKRCPRRQQSDTVGKP